ncbi:hypothetical protein [Sinomonas sp. G460-2]|uniref:hypothetical protein n=1 Tax=Sinomonas sp. G460-2 TaxID=3393464 RepID=UPI0039F0FAEC
MRRHWKAFLAAAIVVAALTVAALILGTRNDQPAAVAAAPVAGGGKLGFPVSPVRIGSGGSGVAADGRTPIGYDGSCDSAAAAAANFMPVIADVRPSAWPAQRKALAQIDVNTGELSDLATLAGLGAKTLKLPNWRSFDGDWVTKTDVAAGGLYRMVTCIDRDKALVQLVYASIDAGTEGAKASFVTQALDLGWQGSDWKVTRSQIPVGSTDLTLGGRLPDRGPNLAALPAPDGRPPVLTRDLADQAFKDVTREGWIEYANALR